MCIYIYIYIYIHIYVCTYRERESKLWFMKWWFSNGSKTPTSKHVCENVVQLGPGEQSKHSVIEIMFGTPLETAVGVKLHAMTKLDVTRYGAYDATQRNVTRRSVA